MEHVIKNTILGLMLLVFAFNPLVASAQESTVKGKVIDDQGPMAGVSVVVQGTQIGTTTDIDGNYQIQIPGGKKYLEFSFLGMLTQTLPIDGRTRIDVVMQSDAIGLEGVQVVAFGVQEKKTVTGALVSVNKEKLLNSASNNIANTLAGNMTGVSTVQATGLPGASAAKIYIRGTGTLNEADGAPLILVDGVERDFSQMDPNEISDITVLKDASATAVFGVRGANGVILVTTTRGEEGRARISLSTQSGVSVPTRLIDVADSYTYASCYNEMSMQEYGNQPFDDRAIEAFRTGSDPILYPDTKWADMLMKKAAYQSKVNLSISGGNKIVKYFVSASHLFDDGLFKEFSKGFSNNYNYNRFNYRANLDINITPSTLLKINIGGIVGRQHRMLDTWKNPIAYIYSSAPFSSYGLNENGELITSRTSRFPIPMEVSPLEKIKDVGYVNQVNNTMQMDAVLDQKLDFITKGLSLNIQGSYNTSYSVSKQRRRIDPEHLVPYEKSELENPGLPYTDPTYDPTLVYRIVGQMEPLLYEESNSKRRDWYLQGSINYDRRFGDHKVTALLLFNESKKYYPSSYGYIPLGYMGIVARATYNYKNRYLFDASMGYNGSENFAPGKTRFGFFPSASLGWVVSEEKFFPTDKVYLKIRGSYGLVGNDRGGSRFLYLPTIWTVDQKGYDFGGKDFREGRLFYANEGKIGNPKVSWEKAAKFNIGLDMTIFSKLSITADYFREHRSNILITPKTIPAVGALSLPIMNMGQVNNNGCEVAIGWRDRAGNFQYDLNANMTYSRNKIIFMDEVKPRHAYKARTGNPTGAVLGYQFERFYDESDFDAEGNLLPELAVPSALVRPGDPKYADMNFDGLINADDQTWNGYGNRPEFVFGLNGNFAYKGWSLSMQWTGATNVTRNFLHGFRDPYYGETTFKFLVDNRWTPENKDKATMPRFTTINKMYSYAQSTLWLKDASYIRLKNLVLQYSFENSERLKKAGFSKLSIYLAGYNLLTFDKIKLTDPEAGTTLGNNINEGMTYPITRIFNLGLKMNF